MKLVTPSYANDLLTMHEKDPRWGTDGAKHTNDVLNVADQYGCATILDYGCGKGRLKPSLLAKTTRYIQVDEYDPGIPGKHQSPKGAHLVVCTDVLEHIEPDCLGDVLVHLHSLTRIVFWGVIALRPAKKRLPNGSNAHLIIKDPSWWIERLKFVGFEPQEMWHKPGKEMTLLCRPGSPMAPTQSS